jgi:hypothetical protein
MVDYYTVMARAVSGLPNNTADARHILYERARAALVATLTGQSPSVTEADIERERLALEKGIQKVEDEALLNQASELQTTQRPTQSDSTTELTNSVEAGQRFHFGTSDAKQVESEPDALNLKSQRPLIRFRSLDLNLFRLSCVILLALAALILAVGDTWLANRILNNLILVASAAVILCALGMIPLNWPRPIIAMSVYVFLISSYLFGITTWLLGVLATFQYWGWVGLSIGLCLGVVGVVPLGMIASALHSDWSVVGVILVGTLVAYGARDLARERATAQE